MNNWSSYGSVFQKILSWHFERCHDSSLCELQGGVELVPDYTYIFSLENNYGRIFVRQPVRRWRYILARQWSSAFCFCRAKFPWRKLLEGRLVKENHEEESLPHNLMTLDKLRFISEHQQETIDVNLCRKMHARQNDEMHSKWWRNFRKSSLIFFVHHTSQREE